MIPGYWFIALSAVLLLLATYPFTLYPLSLWAMVRLRPRAIRPGAPPVSAALCVCAYNEEQVIEAKIENMLALREAFPQLEILVYVDAASDRTAEILRRYEPAIRVVVSPRRWGKTYGMNRLVDMTSAQCLVFSDANVMFAPDAIPALLAPFSDPTVGLVCGHLRYGASNGNMTAATGSLYWRLEEQIKRLESECGSVIGADGSIFALRRELHRPVPIDLIDDLYVSLMVLCEGARVVRAENAWASEASVSQPAEEFGRKVRIACQAFNVHRAIWPRLRNLSLVDQYKYVSHKLLRWLVVYFLAGSVAALAIGLGLMHAWFMLAVLAAVGAAVAAVLGTAVSGTAMALRSILSAFLATGEGVLSSLRGKRFQTWNPPGSARTVSPAPQRAAF
jgi:cellulose synthase/poly-beta-1,6-N-acetylglucosamine synthase-like glycosyltransferase